MNAVSFEDLVFWKKKKKKKRKWIMWRLWMNLMHACDSAICLFVSSHNHDNNCKRTLVFVWVLSTEYWVLVDSVKEKKTRINFLLCISFFTHLRTSAHGIILYTLSHTIDIWHLSTLLWFHTARDLQRRIRGLAW